MNSKEIKLFGLVKSNLDLFKKKKTSSELNLHFRVQVLVCSFYDHQKQKIIKLNKFNQ